MDIDLTVLRSGEEEEREAAAERLMARGPVVVPHVVDVLKVGDVDSRWWAARILAGIPGSEATAALISALLDPDEDVIVCAALGLGERGETQPSVVAALLTQLRCCGHYAGRHVSDALSKIGEPAVGALIEALEDSRPSVRVLAARALSRVLSPSSIPALVKALDDPEAAVEHYALDALQRMGVGITVLLQP